MGFFSDLMGTSAKKDLKRSKKASDRELQAGYDEAQPFYEEASELFSPFVEQGTQANKLYSQAIGLGTPEERATAQGIYFSDPAMQAVLGQQSNALLKRLNAGGSGTGGGKLALAGTRVGLENYENWLNRLSGAGSQGLGAAGAKAGITTGQGDMRFGLGLTKAGQEINFGNAMAANRSTGLNNLLNIGGTAAKVATAFSDIRLKRDITRVGALPSGLPVYRFRYNWSDDIYQGVMAHEAEKFFPSAVSYNDQGFAMVDYSKVS